MNSKANAWLDQQAEAMRVDLVELANQNSGSNNIQGLMRVAGWLQDWVAFDDAKFESQDLPPRIVITDQGEKEAFTTGPLLRWDFQPNCKRRVLLAIHYDTVFGPESGFQTCTRIEDDKLGGPGVADAKGGIVVLRYALQALQRFHPSAELGWTVVLNPDEEVGSLSSTEYLQMIAPDFDFGLLFEPALPTGELVGARKGSGNFDIVVRGQSAHAGRHFENGRNAVAILSQLMVDLHALNGQRDGTTINVGYVHGGGAVNVVPDLAVGRLNVRVQDANCTDWFMGAANSLIKDSNSKDGFEVEMFGGITSPPKPVTDESRQLMTAIESVVKEVEARELTWKSTGGVCDGNKLAAAGLPNIDTLGPVGDGLHSSREWVQVSSLPTKAKVIAGVLAGFASGKFLGLERSK